MITFGYILAMWDRIFSKTNKEETKKEEIKNGPLH